MLRTVNSGFSRHICSSPALVQIVIIFSGSFETPFSVPHLNCLLEILDRGRKPLELGDLLKSSEGNVFISSLISNH
jgi:hypothetical protein